MTDTVLLATNVQPAFRAALADRYETLGPLTQPFEPAASALSAAEAARVRAIVTMGSLVIPQASLDRFPALGLLACVGSGYEGMPVAAARQRGIEVTHSPGANAASVADLAMGLMISSVRNLDGARSFLQAGHFQGTAGRRLPPVRGLTGRRLGIYGLGAIGHKIALRAAPFEMEIAYHNRRARTDVPYPWLPSLHALAQWSDVLMVAARADASNHHAIDHDVLAALGAGGVVVNISRGSIIDEAALVAALQAGLVAGAGLDVFEHEPRVTPALFELPQVALSPHIGGNTHEAQDAMRLMVLDNLAAFFAGRAPLTPVPD